MGWGGEGEGAEGRRRAWGRGEEKGRGKGRSGQRAEERGGGVVLAETRKKA